MSMLSSPVILNGADLEKICRRALNDTGGRQLTPQDYDDALAWLLGEIVELAARFNPQHERASWSFANHALYILRLRVNSWWRQHEYDTRHERRNGNTPRPTNISLDWHIETTGDTRLGPTLTIPASLPNLDRDPNGIPRSLHRRRSQRTWALCAIRAEMQKPFTTSTRTA